MITRVRGELNGVGMLPVLVIGDRYHFKLPPTLTGKFICQFWAEDDYGNVAYESAILTLFEGMVKCIQVLTREWSMTMLKDNWTIEQDTISEWGIDILPITCGENMMEVY